MEVVIGDLRFSASTGGDPTAPMVLMLHGFPQTDHSWRHQIQGLGAAGYFAVAPNQRGYSAGARLSEQAAYATDNLVGDAIAIASALGHERFHLVGHDWGGQLAWLLASAHPERVMSLAVLSRPHPAAFARSLDADPDQAERSKHHRAFDNPDTAALLLQDDCRRLRRIWSQQGVPDVAAQAYLSVLLEEGALEAALNWYRAAAGLALPEVPPVRVPTLYVWGDQDASVGRVAAEATGDFVSAPYRFEELTGVGHFVTDEQGERVTDMLLEFIRALGDS